MARRKTLAAAPAPAVDPNELAPGQAVRIRPIDCVIGIDHRFRGGEGRIVRRLPDMDGSGREIYAVEQQCRDGETKLRHVLRQHLVVHRTPLARGAR